MSRRHAMAGWSSAGLVLAAAVMVSGVVGSASASPGNVGGNVGISWSLPNVPASGVSNLTFPMTVNPATARAAGTYFAQQYNFTNAPDVGYTGLQPRADLNGHQRLHGVFSSFNAGTTTTDANCHNGADGGPGVSCAVDFDAVYGDTYNITVARTGTDIWTGTATDTATGVAIHIGSYKMPTGSGSLRGSQGGFVEYYLGVPTCAQLVRTDVVFGGPTSTDAGGLHGTTYGAYQYSECVGQANFSSTTVGSGLHLTRGWVPGGGGGTSSTLVNAASGRCLDAPSTTSGTQMDIRDCQQGAADQQWTATSGNALTSGGKCLDASGAGTAPGTKVILWDCHGGTNQQWVLNADGTIRGVQSGLCVTPAGNGTANGTVTVLATCTGATGQRWTKV